MSFFKRFGGSKTSQRSSGSDNESSAASSPKGSGEGAGLTLTKTTSSSRLGRVFSGGFRSRKLSNKGAYAHLHKPFTPENLEHQKILNAFEWNFGTKRNSFDSSFSGISPCTSRRGSMSDGERSLPPFDCADLSARIKKSSMDDEDVAPDAMPSN
ncbi:uncharacterized protein B0I36DRAFT_344691 [Microdochium trichocladiopsis]|uniref:Uncharacterized protein n=1 Tax=Microdochium trichocladiopsis TaxID=1682393 RepID=A0A9P8YL96_9PEZI|nr:uncharacterized protein B0I36DRAFT_344691 [Microdochium trichocladiopsis]KAH7041050.1 hypothetical protein B0I36DRAFT_344691 [Microdochium trichocladiopsis]